MFRKTQTPEQIAAQVALNDQYTQRLREKQWQAKVDSAESQIAYLEAQVSEERIAKIKSSIRAWKLRLKHLKDNPPD